MIRSPRLWQLYLAIGRDGLDVMIYTPLEEHSLITANIPYDDASTPLAKAVENAVYDNPLLLSDFKKVTILVRDTPHTITPSDMEDPALRTLVTDEMLGASEAEALSDRLPLLGADVIYRIDSDLLHFLQRTFNNPTFTHRVSALTRYWHGTNRATGSMTSYVNLRPGATDIVSFAGNSLLVANSYDTPTPTDTLYYIMALREMTGASADKPVVIAGDRETRELLTPMLAPYVTQILPAVFPVAMFRAGGQTAMNTPLDLVVLPLCE